MTFLKIYPTYCPNCSQLMFLGKHQSQELCAIDYQKANWIPHNCTDDKSHIYENDLIIDHINEEDQQAPIPFVWQKKKSDQTKKSLKPGVVLSVENNDETKILEVITVDNSQLSIKVVKDDSAVQPGFVLDLKKATRTGKNKYRISQVSQIDVSSENFDNDGVLQEFYAINISGTDQEKLELLIDKVIQHFRQNHISAFGIIPLPITKKVSESIFTRRIFIKPVDALVQKIKLLHLPEEFEVFIEQIKIS